jgi:hypothetical protein
LALIAQPMNPLPAIGEASGERLSDNGRRHVQGAIDDDATNGPGISHVGKKKSENE